MTNSNSILNSITDTHVIILTSLYWIVSYDPSISTILYYLYALILMCFIKSIAVIIIKELLDTLIARNNRNLK